MNAIFIADGLMAGRQIDNGQSPMTEANKIASARLLFVIALGLLTRTV